jgi:hypothetical protein
MTLVVDGSLELEMFECYLIDSALIKDGAGGSQDNPKVFEGPWSKASKILSHELGQLDYSRITRSKKKHG